MPIEPPSRRRRAGVRFALWIGVWGGLAVWAAPTGRTFDRYQVILDRKPFGSETTPTAVAAAAPGTPAAQAAAAFNALKMSAIIEDSAGGLLVGIFDPQKNTSTMLKVGETENGIELLEADYAGERAQIRMEGLERWISMSGEDTLAATPSPRAAPTAPARAAARGSRRTTGPIAKGMTKAEYEKNKHKFPAPRSAKRALLNIPEEAPMTPEEHDAVMQEYNMELIRAGGELGPALPIELTPEQDAQLVQEGVLPPLE